MNKAKFNYVIPTATPAVVLVTTFEDDEMMDDAMMSAMRSHHTKKTIARENYRANGTHPRDHAETLKHNRYRRGEKLYNKAGRTRKRKEAAKRDFKAEIDLVFSNKQRGFGYIEDAEMFYEAGYDAGFDDCYTAICDKLTEEFEPESPMPWENRELVMYLYDDAVSFISKHQKTKEKYATEFNLMRATLEYSVNKLNNSKIPVLADIIFPEDILMVLLGENGYAYMTELSMHHLMENVAHNLYALYNQPELYQYYQELLQNRNANCE